VALSDAVLKCLAKDPEDRYSSMEELAAVLGAVLPSGAVDRKESVSRLAAPFGMPDQGDLLPAAGTGEETSVLRPARGLTGKDAPEQSARSENGALETGLEAAGQTFLVGDSEYDVHPLELDPPAELPPLELYGTGESGPAPDPPPVPVGGETEIPLSLKELPADENVEADGVPSAGRGGIRRYFLWSLPVILLIAAAGVWRFSGGPVSTLLPAKMINPAEPAKLTVLTEPGTSIFMDGKLLGEASPSGSFDVKPGLHRIEVRNPRLGERTIIVEIEPGESKRIEVKFTE